MYITIDELKEMQEKCIEEKRSIDARLAVVCELIKLAESKEPVVEETVEVSVGFEQSEEIEIQDEIA